MKLKFYIWEGTITLGSNSCLVLSSEADVPEPFATELKKLGLAWDAPTPVIPPKEEKVEPAEEEEPVAEETPIAEEAVEEPEELSKPIEEEPPVYPKRSRGRRKKTSTITEVI